jgi:hypothetical protein
MTPRPDSGRFSLVAVMTSAQRSRLRRRGISDDFTFSTRAFNNDRDDYDDDPDG